MSYTSENIFSDPRINALCDRIYALMYEALPPTGAEALNYIYVGFVLSGRAGAILQGATQQPVKNIVFETSNPLLFAWCKSNLAEKFVNCKRIILKERILIYPNDFIVEILFSESVLDAVQIETDIFANTIGKIPNQTL